MEYDKYLEEQPDPIVAPAPRVASYAGQDVVMLDVLRERRKQDRQWGEQNHHPFQWRSILGEECGEVDKAVNEATWGAKSQHAGGVGRLPC